MHTVLAALQTFVSPSAAQKYHYSYFEQHTPQPKEDPTLSMWELCQIVENADSTLTDEAKKALLSCQFMKGLPRAMRICLLENKPTPTLTTMRDFIHHFHAVQSDLTYDLSAVCLAND